MGVMPHKVESSDQVLGFETLSERFNDGLGDDPAGAFRARRDQAIEKLQQMNDDEDFDDLLVNLAFHDGDDEAALQTGDPDLYREVFVHFATDWDLWFPLIPFNLMKRRVGKGFLAALLLADEDRPAENPRPITVVWVCANRDNRSGDFFVEPIVTPYEVVVVIATPLPPMYDPDELESHTEQALEALGGSTS